MTEQTKSMLTIENVIAMYDFPKEKECPHCKVVFKWEKVLQFEGSIGLQLPLHEPCGENKCLSSFRFTDEKFNNEIKEVFDAFSEILEPGDTLMSCGDEIKIIKAKKKKKKEAKKAKKRNRK